MRSFLKRLKSKKLKEIFLVIAQLIILLLHLHNFTDFKSLVFFQSNTYKNYFGVFLIFLGFIGTIKSIKDLGKNISPLPEPLKNSSLVTSGFYKWISHPIYYSCILISIGIFIRYLSWFNLFLTISLIIILKLKIIIEEEYLISKYRNYRAYRKHLKL